MATTSALEQLQAGLERIYRLDPAPTVTGFLIAGSGQRREELLLLEEEQLYIGVVLDLRVLMGLDSDRLARTNLEAFCLAVEAVSHFLFVTHRARQECPTSMLELELQAEIDKYVAALMLAARCPTLASEALRAQLYHGYRLVDGLSRAEQQRYHRATALARRYARALELRFVRPDRLPAMLGELRRFYRLTCRAKQELIHRC